MKKIKILIPNYNDWKSVFKLLENIDLEISDWDAEVSILIINDASTEKMPENNFNFKNIKSTKIVNMKENRGHQRSTAAGLKYISEKEDFDYVIPMDGDGEDRPEELNLLFSKMNKYPDKVITANRVKRSEGLIFTFCYVIHKYLTFFFTGNVIKFGNYTCLPKIVVNNMVKDASTWSSFSGTLVKICKDRFSISSIRGTRYFGPSKMSFFALIKHSLSINAVFKKTVIIRSIIFLLVYFFFIYQSLSVITIIPVIFVFLMIYSVIFLSRRENLNEFNLSLNNIESIENLS